MKNNVSLYLPIEKIDEDQRMVYGYASTEALDSHGEVVKKDAIERALPDYMKFANIREMHEPSAVGVAKQAIMNEKGLYLGAKVVDDDAWAKVKEGVYKGFSIGGKKIMQKGKDILDLVLNEISLVDRPANPEALFDVYKTDQNGEMSHEDIKAELCEALNEGTPMGYPVEWGVIEVYSDSVIAYHFEDETYWSIKYEIDPSGEAIFGDMTEVKLTWEPKPSPAGASDEVDAEQEIAGIAKVIGYTPWYMNYLKPKNIIKKFMKKSDLMKQQIEEKKEETVEVKTGDAPKEESVEKIGAKFSKTNMDSIKSAIKLLQDMIAADDPTEDPQDNNKMISDNTLEKMFESQIAKVEGLIDSRIKPLKEQIDSFAKAPLPIKTQASFIQKKGDEVMSDETKKDAMKEVETIKANLEKINEKRGSMSMNDFQSKYGSEIQHDVAKMRSIKQNLGL